MFSCNVKESLALERKQQVYYCSKNSVVIKVVLGETLWLARKNWRG
jgi:hypothetical protein